MAAEHRHTGICFGVGGFSSFFFFSPPNLAGDTLHKDIVVGEGRRPIRRRIHDIAD